MERGIHKEVREFLKEVDEKNKPTPYDFSKHKNIIFIGKASWFAAGMFLSFSILNTLGITGRGYSEPEIKPRVEDIRRPDYNKGDYRTPKISAAPTPLPRN
jgi:hypothetical protein